MSLRSNAAARGAARAAATAAKGGASSLNSAGQAALARSGSSSPAPAKTVSSVRDAAAGLASLAAARGAAGVSATPADLRNYAAQEAQAQADLQQMGYSPEFVNQVSTFWQGLSQLPKDQQDKIMSQLQSQANATVDYSFDAEQQYLNQLKAAKQANYDDQLSLFKKQEADDLAKILGDTSRGAGDQLQSAFAGLAKNNSFDSGQSQSIASRAIEDYMRQISQAQGDSANAINRAQQQRDSASNLLSIQAEQDLNDVANQRTAARSQRLSQLIGLNASQQLLAQVPTANQISLPPPSTKSTTPTKPAAAPLALPSMDAGGYRNTSYASTLQANVAARKTARIAKNNLVGNY